MICLLSQLLTFLDENDTASVTLQKETETGSTSTSSKYNVIMVSSYATAIVDEVVDKTNDISINFDDQSSRIKSKMTIHKDDDTYSYSFKLDGKEIEPTELQEGDVLNIAYDVNDSC